MKPCVGIAAICFPIALGLPQDAPTPEVTPEIRAAVTKALDVVAQLQRRDGSWDGLNKVAKTALAGMAFLANGSLPDRGRYHDAINRCMNFILECSRRRHGHITDWKTNDWSDTHNHGYGLLFFALVYGSVRDSATSERLKEAIERGIAFSIKAQTANGGWGYSITTPNHNGFKDEGSCTITQIAALRACRDAGFLVQKEAIDRAVEYIKKCAFKRGFYYSLEYGGKPLVRLGDSAFNSESKPRFAITAASVSVLNAYGASRASTPELAKLIEDGLDYISEFVPQRKAKFDDSDFYYYGNFYAAQSMLVAGGRRWKMYWPSVRDELIKRRSPRGIWEDEKRWGYADEIVDTALATLILQAPYRLLPIFVE